MRAERSGHHLPLVAAWRRLSDRVRVAATFVALGIAGVLLHHSWLTLRPLSVADWHWYDRGRMLTWWPWPTLWDRTHVFGEMAFKSSFGDPSLALAGLFARLGAGWSLAEKAIYFVPYAFLLPGAIWLLAREIMGRTRWALLAPVILEGASYFLLEGDQHVPLPLADAVACIALVVLIRALRRGSMALAVLTGLLLGLTTAVELRSGYLSLLLMVLYYAVLAVTDRDLRRFIRRTLQGVVVVLVFVGTQAYWWLPFLTYHGQTNLPVPSTPDFPILTLGHGIAAAHPYWTGSFPAQLVEAPLFVALLLMPLLALASLLARRLSAEVLWLILASLLFAFLAKTDTPPFGTVYDLVYAHVPGFKLFREGSKFLSIIAISQAVLIPVALRAMSERARAAREWRPLLHSAVATACAAVVLLSVVAVVPLERGTLLSTTVPTTEPASMQDFTRTVTADHTEGAILWFGGADHFSEDLRHHYFWVTTGEHSLEALSGLWAAREPGHRDPFQYFCPQIDLAYCYVEPGLFPYLTRMVGARYIVAPVGARMGVLHGGVSRPWLVDRLTGMFGAPRIVGTGGEQLATWRLEPEPTVIGAPSVAEIESGSWSTSATLPALTALDLPAVYTQTLDRAERPPAPANLPGSIAVLPHVDGSCRSSVPRSVALLAPSSGNELQVTAAGAMTALPMLAQPQRLPGWAFYGPLRLGSGATAISSSQAAIGPCVEWSARTVAALGPRVSTIGPASYRSLAERFSAPLTGPTPAWIELRRGFASGWRLAGAGPVILGDGLFNLYHTGGAGSAGRSALVFQLSTETWERRGQLLTVLTLLVVAVVVVRARRRPGPARGWAPVVIHTQGIAPRLLAGAGLAALAVTTLLAALEGWGTPAQYPGVAVGGDPYHLDIGAGTIALGLLLGSALLRLVGTGPRASTVPVRRGAATFATAMVGALLLPAALSACGTSRPDAPAADASTSDLFADAAVSGQDSPNAVAGSVEEARIAAAVRNPRRCIADYTQILTIYPSLGSAYSGRAHCLAGLGLDRGPIVSDLNRAIELGATDSSLVLRRGEWDVLNGDRNAAVADLLAAAALPSATPSTYLASVDTLVFLHRLVEARSIAEQGLRRIPTAPFAHLAEAEIDAAQDQDGPALDQLGQAVALARSAQSAGDLAQALARRANFSIARHDYTAASADCREVVTLTVDSSGAFDDWANADLGLGHIDDAVRHFTSAIGAFTGNAGVDAQPSGVDGYGLSLLYEARGRAEVEAHHADQGARDFKEAERLLPPSAAVPVSNPDFRDRDDNEYKSARSS